MEWVVCLRIEYKFSEYAKIERLWQQGHVFLPDLFNLYNAMIWTGLDDVLDLSAGITIFVMSNAV